MAERGGGSENQGPVNPAEELALLQHEVAETQLPDHIHLLYPRRPLTGLQGQA